MKYKLDNPKYTKFVDKLQFKEYCKSKGIDTIKIFKIYDQKDYDKINLKDLPDKFILKSNKGAKRNFIVDSNIRKKMLNEIINQCPNPKIKLRRQISKWGDVFNPNEPQYEYIKPKIFVEELIEPRPVSIRLYYLNYRLTLIRTDLYYIRGFYDINKNRINIMENKFIYNGKTVIDKMSDGKFKELISLSNKLASDIDLDCFAVDFFYFDDKFYGGELTLSPSRGNSEYKYI